jgi:hypothetical protein
MGDESDFDCENNINEAARAYCDNLLPSVSRERYEISWNLKHGVTGKT